MFRNQYTLIMRSLKIIAAFSVLVGASAHSEAAFYLGPSNSYRWSTAYDYGNENYVDTAIDLNNAVFALGETDGPISDFNSSNKKMFIHHWNSDYASDGSLKWSIAWEKAFESKSEEFFPSAIRSFRGNGLLVYYTKTEIASYKNTILLTKLDKTNGSELWTKTFNDFDESLWVVSKETERFATVSPDYWDNKSVVTVYDQNAVVLWSQTMPFDVSSIQFTIDDQIVLGGMDRPDGAPALPAFYRLSRTGKILHQFRIPNTGAGSITSVPTDSEGNVYLVNTIKNGASIGLVKYSPSGELVWQKVFAADNKNFGNTVNAAVIFGRLFIFEGFFYIFDANGNYETKLTYSSNVDYWNSFTHGDNGFLVSAGKGYYNDSKYDAEISFTPVDADPSVMFSGLGGWQAYLADNVDLFNSGIHDEASAFAHWRDYGSKQGRGFDTGRLRSDLPGGAKDPQYAIDGGFAWQYYNADGNKGDTMVFITKDAPKPSGWDGRPLLLKKGDLFNLGPEYTASGYRTLNSDVANAIDSNLFPSFASVTDHYVKYGFKEGRLTNSNWTQGEFNAWTDARYLAQNPDVNNFFMGAQSEGWKLFGKIGFAHYVNFGKWEGRKTGQ
jgi:hypothetical protein